MTGWARSQTQTRPKAGWARLSLAGRGIMAIPSPHC